MKSSKVSMSPDLNGQDEISTEVDYNIRVNSHELTYQF
jgi:hypothetical protein